MRPARPIISLRNYLDRLLPLFILQIGFLGLALFYVWIIPLNAAPDEGIRYKYNVKFLISQHRLPVAGVDDIQLYRIPYVSPKQSGGLGTTLTSNAQYPQHPYIIAATIAWAANRVLGVAYYTGARLSSTLFGLLYLTFLYLTTWKISRRRSAAFAITFSFSFIPQVIFISAYINVDMFSLALSSFLTFAYVNWVENPTMSREWLLAFAIAAMTIAKYNYILYGPIILISLYWAYKWRSAPIINLLFKTFFLILIVAGPTYLRNYYYYRDPFGTSFLLSTMEKYNKPTPRIYSNPFSLSSWMYLWRDGWFGLVFDSFFLRFGYMNVGLEAEIYALLRQAVAVWALILCTFACIKESTRERYMLAAVLLFLGLNIFLSGWNSIVIDYQAQGRYIFTTIMPIACILALMCRRSTSYIKFSFGLACIVALLIIPSLQLLTKTYARSIGLPGRYYKM